MIGSGLRLPDQLHQSRGYLEPDVMALTAALADDEAHPAPPLRRAPCAGGLEVSREGVAPVKADTDASLSFHHRRGELLFRQLHASGQVHSFSPFQPPSCLDPPLTY